MAYLKVLSALHIVHFPCITHFYLSPTKCIWNFFVQIISQLKLATIQYCAQ